MFERVKEGVEIFFQFMPDSDLDSNQKFPPQRMTDREQLSSGKKEKGKLSSMQWTLAKYYLVWYGTYISLFLLVTESREIGFIETLTCNSRVLEVH
jgi:hypothetical protein